MSKVKLNFRNLSIPEKIARAREIIAKLTGNPNFPNPAPPLATMTAATNDLETSQTTVSSTKRAWRAATVDQAAKEDIIDQLFSQSASYVEGVAGSDESIIASAGMDVRGPAGPSAMPDVPANFGVTIGDHEGELDASWNPVANAVSYVIQKSLDPNVATGWTHAGTSTKSNITIDGLTSGTRYWFRVAAIGAGGQSGWSNPDTKIAP